MRPLRTGILLRPLPLRLFVPLAVLVLVGGAAYCLGYEELQSGDARWPLGLLWSAHAVLPWLFFFEWIKRREWSAGEPMAFVTVCSILLGIVTLSLTAEGAINRLLPAQGNSPLGLQIMRRLPAIGAAVLLLLLTRREQRRAERHVASSAEATTTETEALRRHASSIHWIHAADNYLELHLEGQVWTRRVTMRRAAAILEPLGFVRVHRSFIVNRNHVDVVVHQSGGDAIRMSDGTAVPTGKAFSENLQRLK